MKKLIACLVLLAMLVSALAACSSGKKNPDGTKPVGSAPTGPVDEYGRPLVSNPILTEGIRYDNETIKILYFDPNQIYDPDLVGEKVNDANFSRDMAVEAALGVYLDWIYTDCGTQAETFNTLVKTSVTAGTGGTVYNILMANSYYSANMAMDGYFRNMMDLKYVDYDQPWWVEKVMDEITINGVSYFASGDITNSACASTTCLFYNKNLYEQHWAGENIYEQVFENKWTMERFMEMVEAAHLEKDGVSGTSEGDILGLATSPSAAQSDPFLYGLGVRVTRVNADNELQIALGDEWSVNAFAKTYQLFQDTDGVYYRKDDPTNYEWAYPKFAASQALFLADSFGATKYFNDMNARYGVLPIPMFDEAQGEYYSGGIGGLLAIPTNVPNDKLDATAATLDLLNFYGYQYVVPMYFEKMLKVQYSDAPEDARVYDLLNDAKWADFGIIYSFAMEDPLWSWRKQLRTESNNISNFWSENMNTYVTGLQEIQDSFRLPA